MSRLPRLFDPGDRVVVLRDNGRDCLVGHQGVVEQVNQSGVVVVLDNDPAKSFRMYNQFGFDPNPRSARSQNWVIRRFFRLDEVQKI